MNTVLATPLFFEPGIETVQLRSMVFQAVEIPQSDIVEFSDEHGGDVQREMGLPSLLGADEIVVDRAELQLRAQEKAMEVQFTSHPSPDRIGVMLSLASPARLKKVEISFPSQSGATRTVVRTLTPAGAVGPPIYAAGSFAAPGAMFPRVLDGMTAQSITSPDAGKSRQMLLLPSIQGSSWVIQLATGDDVASLAPQPVAITIHSVTIAALPQNLKITLAADSGEVALWSHPGLLLPEIGFQNVSFSPLAQKHLAGKLKSAGSSSAITLALPLKFHSDNGCAVEVSSKILQAQYVVNPLPSDPQNLQLRGDWESLDLQALGQTRIAGNKFRITAKLLGREMNGGTPDPPFDPPFFGFKVNQTISVAVAYHFLPLAGLPAGSVLNLVNVRLYLGTANNKSSAPGDAAKTEVVLEIHNDVAASPGPMVASAVAQLKSGSPGWVEFELRKPLPVSTGQSPLWLVLRSNKGEVLWFSTPAGAGEKPMVRLSSTQGKTWGVPDPSLLEAGIPLAQLFHPVPDPQSSPAVQVRFGTAILSTNLMGTPAGKPPKQYVSDGISLPASVLSQLASAAGQGRVTTGLKVFSRTVADLKIEGMQLFYDPFQTPAGGA